MIDEMYLKELKLCKVLVNFQSTQKHTNKSYDDKYRKCGVSKQNISVICIDTTKTLR